MKRFLQSIRHFIIRVNLPLGLKLLYRYYFHRSLDLEHPKTLNEKIQWMKVNLYGFHQNPIFTKCADKYAVREYVEKCELGSLLNSLIAVYDHPSEIEWNNLPSKFAIKWNFGNGYNIVCTDKSKLNIPSTIKKLEEWGKEEAWLKTGEVQYRYALKKIIVEDFIEAERGALPVDYKLYCFYGEPYLLFTCEERGEGRETKFIYFDLEWNHLLSIPKDAEISSVTKPHHLKEMIEYSRVLSKPFPFVRVDFFDTPEQLYFGELTFTPGGGFDTEEPLSLQLELGSMLDINNTNVSNNEYQSRLYLGDGR